MPDAVNRKPLLALCLALASASAAALPLLPTPRPGPLPQPGDGFVPRGREAEDLHRDLDANDAAERAQQINGGGRVLSVEEARGGWRVKLLKEGNVRIVFVPD